MKNLLSEQWTSFKMFPPNISSRDITPQRNTYNIFHKYTWRMSWENSSISASGGIYLVRDQYLFIKNVPHKSWFMGRCRLMPFQFCWPGKTVHTGCPFHSWLFHYDSHQWTICVTVIPFWVITSLQNCAHATTAKLLCHMQIFVVIRLSNFRWEQNKILSSIWITVTNIISSIEAGSLAPDPWNRVWDHCIHKLSSSGWNAKIIFIGAHFVTSSNIHVLPGVWCLSLVHYVINLARNKLKFVCLKLRLTQEFDLLPVVVWNKSLSQGARWWCHNCVI